jgi:hypothetical protein
MSKPVRDEIPISELAARLLQDRCEEVKAAVREVVEAALNSDSNKNLHPMELQGGNKS